MAVTVSLELESLKPNFRTNTFTLGPQLAPDALGLSSGGFVTAYNNVSLTSGLILLDFYDAGFQSVGSVSIPFDDSATTDAAGEPSVTQLANGNVLVVWDEQNDTNSEAGIKGALFTQTGSVIATDIHLESGGIAFKDIDVTALSNGNFAVSFAFGSFEMFELFTPSGSKIGGDHIMNTVTTGTQKDAQLIGLTDGGLVAAWTDVNTDRLKFRAFASDGAATTAELSLLPAGAGKVALAALADGGWAAAYRDTSLAEPGSNESGISLLLVRAGDVSDVLRVEVSDASIFAGTDPDITVLDNGFILVTWNIPVGAGRSQVLGRVFDADGGAVVIDGHSGGFALSGVLNNSTLSSASAIAAGQFVASWQDSQSDGSSGQITSAISEVVRSSVGDDSRNVIVGDALRDVMDGGKGADTLNGGDGNDSLLGGQGSDSLLGGAGDDTIDGGARPDSIDGGAGNDRLFAGPAPADAPFDHDAIIGGEGDDTITGAATGDSLDGEEGRDSIDGGPGSDTLRGGIGSDTINGGDDGDVIFAGPGAQGFGEGSDPNVVNGDGGNDFINGEKGNDTLSGGEGDDNLEGRGGADSLIGGNGVDEVVYLGFSGVTVNLTTGLGSGNDAEGDVYVSIENVTGSGTGDHLIGNAANNVLDGVVGSDTLEGGEGRDRLIGGNGGGSDVLIGGKDRDVLTGELNDDTFVFRTFRESTVAKPDVITDFSHEQADKIDLSAIDARTGGKDNAFVLVAAFTGVAGELIAPSAGGISFLVQADVNGDGVADFAIDVRSSAALTSDDFVL